MANLKIINKAIEEGLSLEIARENEKIEQEQERFKEQYNKELESLGVLII